MIIFLTKVLVFWFEVKEGIFFRESVFRWWFFLQLTELISLADVLYIEMKCFPWQIVFSHNLFFFFFIFLFFLFLFHWQLFSSFFPFFLFYFPFSSLFYSFLLFFFLFFLIFFLWFFLSLMLYYFPFTLFCYLCHWWIWSSYIWEYVKNERKSWQQCTTGWQT